jgi:HK97 family phage major capsid protein
MDTAVKEDKAVLDLAARMQGLSKEEQAKALRTYMEENLGVKDEAPVVQLTDDQIRMLATGAADTAKEVAKDVASDVERRYHMGRGQAEELAHDTVGSEFVKQQHRQRDYEEAAKVIRAISRTAKGSAAPGELHAAYDAEKEYIRSTGREVRAMSIGTDTSGGYLGGELFETMLYDNVSRYGYARKYATLLPMTKEILRLPKLTATMTAEQTNEATAITESEPTFAQFTLNTKKLAVLTTPFSIELFETADPAIVPLLIEFATREITKKEDALVFGTGAPGILSHTTNNVTLGSGDTAITKVDFDDMIDLIYELDPHYLPDEDVQGSGLFSSQARFWVPQSLVQALSKVKGNDNYHWSTVQELKHNKNIHGYEVKRVPGMTAAPAAAARAACFGDLKKMVCGVRPGFRIELQSQGTVDSVNLNETGSYAVRVIEFFDCDSIDDEAFSVLKLAAS